jgi:FtsH-binding integral membrane protein
LYGAARVNFIQKVYTILAAQLVLTVLICALSMTSLTFFKFQVENIALFYLVMVGAVVTQIWIFCCRGGKTYPLNVILTSIFTLCEAYIVSFLCSATGMQSGNAIVFEAAFMTLVVVVVCSVYALYTK